MPIHASVRNQLLGMIDSLFDEVDAGTAFTSADWVHQSFGFTANGHSYVATVRPERYQSRASVIVTIKRTT